SFVIFDIEVTYRYPIFQRQPVIQDLRLITVIILQTRFSLSQQILLRSLNDHDCPCVLRGLARRIRILSQKSAHCFQRAVEIAREVIKPAKIVDVRRNQLARRERGCVSSCQVSLLLLDFFLELFVEGHFALLELFEFFPSVVVSVVEELSSGS